MRRDFDYRRIPGHNDIIKLFEYFEQIEDLDKQSNKEKIIEKEINDGLFKPGIKHLTLRVAWHDSNWNGKICKSPIDNIYCSGYNSLLSDRIRRNKEENLQIEIDNAGKSFEEVFQEHKYPPPSDSLLYAAYVNRGNISSELCEYQDSLSDYNKAITINPTCEDAYINRGNLFLDLGFYNEALSDYDKALEINPKSIDALNNRGNLYRIIENYEKSYEDLNKVLEADPDYGVALLNRGFLREYLNDYCGAIEDFSTVIELGDRYGSAHYQRATIYKEYFGMNEKAMEDFRKAADLGNLNAQRKIHLYELGLN